MSARLPALGWKFIAIVAIAGALAIPAANIRAADNCQHFTHSHYHFPYAHYDEYLYQGHKFVNGFHYNDYHNTYHGDFLSKYCPGQ